MTGNRSLFLTLVGGGVFGNRTEWIVDAIERAVELHTHDELDIAIVSRSSSNPALRSLLEAR